MTNSRWAFLLIMAVVVCSVVLVARQTRNFYKALPATLPTSVPSVPFEEWRPFHSEKAKFKAFFPALPQHATESVKDPKTLHKRIYDMYVSQKNNGTIFMISLITYKDNADVAQPTMLLKTLVKEMMASNPKNELKSMNEGKFQQYPSIDFSIQNDEVHLNGKAFLVGNTLYILSYVAKLVDYNLDEYQHFIKSFEFQNP